MRILLVHNYYRGGSPGGEDIVFESERALLESAGHDVRVYTRHNDEMNERRLRDRVSTALSVLGLGRTRDELLSSFSAWRPDIVHVHNSFPLISRTVFDACATADIPSVQTVHNYRWVCSAATHVRDGRLCTECGPRDLSPAVRHRCYRGSLLGSFVIARAIRGEFVQRERGGGPSRYLALTEFAAARMRAAGIDANRIRVRPNFIDPVPIAASRERYAVFTGKLAPEKGLHTLLAAWRTLPDIPLQIVGDGPVRGALQAEAQRLELKNVSFRGMQSREVTRHTVAAASLQIVPSEWFEGMPMVVLEAWAAGTPVVASAIGGLAEMIGENERGLVFTPGDADALATRVRLLWNDARLCDALTTAAIKHVHHHHSPEAALRSLTEIYSELLA